MSSGNIEHLCPDQRSRFVAMELAKKEMEKIVSEQRLKFAPKTRVKPQMSSEFVQVPMCWSAVERKKYERDLTSFSRTTNTKLPM